MPVFRDHVSINVAKNLKAFVNFEAGVTRGEAPVFGKGDGRLRERVEHLERELERKDRDNARLRELFVKQDEGSDGGIAPERVVWSFGSGRTGSSWLNAMLRELEGHVNWGEPLVGKLFSDLYYGQTGSLNRDNKHFIMGDPVKEVWLKSIRSFVLDGINARFPELKDEGYLMVTDPNGSVGAPLIMEAMPESRMILLVRDPRDAVASSLASHQKNGRLYKKVGEEARSTWGADEDPDTFVEGRANFYAANVGSAKEAYATHPGPKTILRYEDLRSDTLPRLHASAVRGDKSPGGGKRPRPGRREARLGEYSRRPERRRRIQPQRGGLVMEGRPHAGTSADRGADNQAAARTVLSGLKRAVCRPLCAVRSQFFAPAHLKMPSRFSSS